MDIKKITCLDDLKTVMNNLPEPDNRSRDLSKKRENKLTKPVGALGRLEKIVSWLATWQGSAQPEILNPACIIFAGNHGVVVKGVSAFPSEVTNQMVQNFDAGGAAINQLCKAANVSMQVVNFALENPTKDITQGPAMTGEEFLAAFKIGASKVKSGIDLLCVGEMGIGNTTVASALSHALFGGKAADWTGLGTGIDKTTLKTKIEVVALAASTNKSDSKGPLELAISLGGFELSAIAGAVIAARLLRIPVILDGFVVTAAVSPFEVEFPGALDHCLVGHVSAELAHQKLLQKLGKKALLDLEMRLGEASGAVLAVPIVRAATLCHKGMATFGDAGVSNKK